MIKTPKNHSTGKITLIIIVICLAIFIYVLGGPQFKEEKIVPTFTAYFPKTLPDGYGDPGKYAPTGNGTYRSFSKDKNTDVVNRRYINNKADGAFTLSEAKKDSNFTCPKIMSILADYTILDKDSGRPTYTKEVEVPCEEVGKDHSGNSVYRQLKVANILHKHYTYEDETYTVTLKDTMVSLTQSLREIDDPGTSKENIRTRNPLSREKVFEILNSLEAQ